MTVEDERAELRDRLEEAYGVYGATFLMDRPPGGWSNLVTVDVLEARLAQLSAELRSEMSELRAEFTSELADLRTEVHDTLRAQTWRLAMLMVAAQGVVVAAIAGILAAFNS